MPPWPERQREFGGGLGHIANVPNGLGDRAGRFAVYRNNVAVALIEALRVRFPVTERLVGEEFFRHLAGTFAATHRPTSPVMSAYGDQLADFMVNFPGLDEAPYAPEMARLEAAMTGSYHAADAEPLDLNALAGIVPDALPHLTLDLHPSVRLLRTAYPVATIWSAHQSADAPAPPEDWSGEAIVVSRPQAEVVVHVVTGGPFAFLSALARGQCIAEAAEAAFGADADFDFGTSLVGLTSLGLFQAIGEPS